MALARVFAHALAGYSCLTVLALAWSLGSGVTRIDPGHVDKSIYMCT